MLIIFLGSDHHLLRSYFSGKDDQGEIPVLIAQAGVYEIASIVREFPSAKLFVIRRDLEASGLLSTLTPHPKVSVIDFEDFVRLTTQHSPCITIQ